MIYHMIFYKVFSGSSRFIQVTRQDRSPSVEVGRFTGNKVYRFRIFERQSLHLDSIVLVFVSSSIVNCPNAPQCSSKWPAVSTNRPQKRQFSGCNQSSGCVRRTGRVPLETRKPLCWSTLCERARRLAQLASVPVRVSPCAWSAT